MEPDTSPVTSKEAPSSPAPSLSDEEWWAGLIEASRRQNSNPWRRLGRVVLFKLRRLAPACLGGTTLVR